MCCFAAILFWLNCKSVYSYWQNERKLLNVEVALDNELFTYNRKCTHTLNTNQTHTHVSHTYTIDMYCTHMHTFAHLVVSWVFVLRILQVRRATEAFMENINRPSQFQTPSIDFSKPRLVQITVLDVGACMPIIPVVRIILMWRTCVTIIPVVGVL